MINPRISILYLLSLLLLNIAHAFAQCKSGDCENGTGTYDFGWCIYTGSFKAGKPDGNGVMKYDDYTYTGTFKNGVENGSGVITYKDGRKETVSYRDGIRIKSDQKVAAADWKPLQGQNDECITGNCINGIGTVLFPSGNKYVGSFVNRRKHGKGVFYFTNGDRFEGTFNADLKENGTYTFNNGYSYTGTFLHDDFYSGTFKAPSGSSVDMRNGKVIIPPPSQLAGSTENSTPCPTKTSCPRCHGNAIESKPIEQKLSWSTKDTYAVDRYGNRTLTYAGQSGGGTYSIPNYVPCGRCGGKGFICK